MIGLHKLELIYEQNDGTMNGWTDRHECWNSYSDNDISLFETLHVGYLFLLVTCLYLNDLTPILKQITVQKCTPKINKVYHCENFSSWTSSFVKKQNQRLLSTILFWQNLKKNLSKIRKNIKVSNFHVMYWFLLHTSK